MSLKSAFNWLKQCLGHQPPPAEDPAIKVSSTVHAQTSDGVFVLIPITLDLKIAEQKKHQFGTLAIDPGQQARNVVVMAIAAKVAGITYADLLKPPDGFPDQIIQSCRKAALDVSGLDLLGIHIEKAQGPAMLADLTQEIEKTHAAAREQLQAIVDAHTSAQGLLKGLDTNIQVKKPLALKKSGQQP